MKTLQGNVFVAIKGSYKNPNLKNQIPNKSQILNTNDQNL